MKLQYAVCHSPFLSAFCYQAPIQIQHLWFSEEQFIKLVSYLKITFPVDGLLEILTEVSN